MARTPTDSSKPGPKPKGIGSSTRKRTTKHDAEKQEERLAGQMAQWAAGIDRSRNMKRRRKRWQELRELQATGLMAWQRRGLSENVFRPKDIVTTNLIETTMQIIVSALYARNPEVSVRPAEAIDPETYDTRRKEARTDEIVVDFYMTRRKELKRAMKRALRSSLLTEVGWIQVAWHESTRVDPLIETQCNDLQAQIDAIDRSIARVQADKSDGDVEQMQIDKARLAAQLTELHPQREKTLWRGMVFERVLPDDLLVDEGLRELADYLNARKIARRHFFTLEEATRKFHLTAEERGQVKRYKAADDEKVDLAGDVASDAPRNDDLVVAYEIWSREDQLIYTVMEGLKRFARPPFEPYPTERFYPWFQIALHWVDGRKYPVSDVSMWSGLQEEYTVTRTAQREFRRRSMPFRVVNGAILDPTDVDKLVNHEIEEVVVLKSLPEEIPPERAVAVPDMPRADPAVFSTEQIRLDLQQVSGAADADRNITPSPKTATEAMQEANARSTRMSDPEDVIADVIEEIASYTLETLHQVLNDDDVAKITGPGAVWEQKEGFETMLRQIEVEPGAAKRPDVARAEQRMQVLFPALQGAILQIAQFKANPQTAGVAEALEKLLKWFLRSLDIRIDLDEFLPNGPAAAPGNAEIPAPPGQPYPPTELNPGQAAMEAGIPPNMNHGG